MIISFWNTGIIHSNDRTSQELQVLQVIHSIFTDENTDILFLCEIDDDFITQLSQSHEIFDNVNLIPATEKFSRNLCFGICALYKKHISLDLIKYNIFNDLDDGLKNTGTNIKVGVEFSVSSGENNPDLSIIVSHWSSKKTPGYEFKHKDAAEELRRECTQLLECGKQVILIGDYNKTPEEIIRDTNLKSYNNKFYVLRDSKRLYNLSFSFNGQHSLLNNNMPGIVNQNGFGTFVSRSSRASENGCAVLDHAHVSSAFLNVGPWLLKEGSTKIIYNDLLKQLIYGKDTLIDHLPISLEVY